jgi:polyamine oxidase
VHRRQFLSLSAAATASLAIAGASATQARAMSIPRPTGFMATRWDSNPWARGSYSALSTRCDPDARETLSEALIGGRVALAGEYTSVDFPSTTNGAYQSGVRAARQVISEVEPTRVIVIGAGIAGAAAAKSLASAGVAVQVLEASDRIFGRIRSSTEWGVPVELGAAWVHFTKGNPVTGLAAAAGVSLVSTDYGDEVIRDTVTGRESSQAENVDGRLSDLTDQLADDSNWPSLSVSSWLGRHGWNPNRFGRWAQAVDITQEYGLDPSTLSVAALQEGAEGAGGDAFVKGGYVAIPKYLLDGIEVRLNQPVNRVEPTGTSVRVVTSRETLTADAVVIAVPLPLLQAGLPGITGMPQGVSRALRGLTTGNLEKVILRYDEQWWGDSQVLGIVGGGVPGAPDGSPAALRWTEFYSLTPLVGFPALVGFSGGLAARTRPATDSGCASEAQARLVAAFRR